MLFKTTAIGIIGGSQKRRPNLRLFLVAASIAVSGFTTEADKHTPEGNSYNALVTLSHDLWVINQGAL